MQGTIEPVKRQPDEHSPLAEALSRVGDRWSFLLVDALGGGPRRFSDLLEALPGIAPNILSNRLKTLTEAGVLVASPYSDRPRRYLYDLTSTGRDLGRALSLVADWGSGGTDHSESQRHPACGTPLEARWFCPTCARTVDPDEGDVHFI